MSPSALVSRIEGDYAGTDEPLQAKQATQSKQVSGGQEGQCDFRGRAMTGFNGMLFNRVTEDAWEAKQGVLPEAQQAVLIRGVFGSCDLAAFPIVFEWYIKGKSLSPHSFDPLRAPYEVVDQRTYQRHKQDEEYPGNFIIAFWWFFCQTIDEDPDPEDGCQRGDAIHSHREEAK